MQPPEQARSSPRRGASVTVLGTPTATQLDDDYEDNGICDEPLEAWYADRGSGAPPPRKRSKRTEAARGMSQAEVRMDALRARVRARQGAGLPASQDSAVNAEAATQRGRKRSRDESADEPGDRKRRAEARAVELALNRL